MSNQKALLGTTVALIALFTFFVNGQTTSWRELLNQSDMLSKQGQIDSALVVGEAALGAAKMTGGESDSSVALVLHVLGRVCNSAFPDKAEAYYRQALAIWQTMPAAQPISMSKTLSNLGSVLRSQGRYSESEVYLRKALEIKKANLPGNDLNTAATLNELGRLYTVTGHYPLAEEYLTEAFNIKRQSLAANNPSMLSSLYNLTNLYYTEARLTEAETLLVETISHLNESADSAGLAACLANLSAVYVASGDLSKAEAVGVRGLQIVTRLSGGDDIGELLFRNLGAVYSLTDRPDSARVCFVRSAALGEKLYGKKSSEYASSLYYLACFYRDTRDFGEADSLFQIILKLRQETLGDRHPLVATTQYSMARLKQFQGDYADAIELAKQSLRLWTETLSDLMTTLSEDDALTYSAGSRWAVNEYFTCFELLGEKSEKLDREAADLCLASKGMVTDRLFLQRDLLSAMQDSATSSLLMQRQELRTKLAKLTAWRTKDPTSFARQGYLDSLSNAEEEVERKLAHRSAVFQSLNPDSEINCRQIAEVLPSGSSLVEYLKYDYSPFSSDSLAARYLALILSRDRQPEFVALGDAKSIDDLINQYRRHMLKVASLAHFPLQSDQKEYERISRALYRRIWKPIEGKIGDTDLIFVAPDGGLNLIAFGGLQNSKGEYVVEKHSLQYLSAGRDLIRLANRVSPASGLLAIGDPDYNAAPNARRSAGKDDQLATAATGGQFRNRSMKSGCKGLAEIRVSPLPGTRKEIEEVVRTWRDAGEGQALTYFGASASEDNFKRCAHGIRVIHLATHGYYYSQECRPNLLKRHMDQNGQYVGENPLLLSGLLLAGANLHGIGSDSLGLDDGNLTAEEISGMDLVGTQLVVLSACETGLGEVKDREGVYGLRRAFQMAGVRTVVSALWPISDQMTSDLMIPFYKSSSKSIPQRLRDIQLAAISKLKSEGLPTHPYLWGAFVAQGDWRP